MAKIETHCADCLRILGNEFKEVHEWLDEYAREYNPHVHLEYHRKFRHHDKGIKKIGEEMGFYAERAAKLHIIRDYEMFLPKPVIDILREDEIDLYYEIALKYCHEPV